MTARFEHTSTTFNSGAPYITAWVDDLEMRKLELGGDCLSVSVSKSIMSHVGQFTITLLPRDGSFLTERGIRSGKEKLPLYFRNIRLNTPISIGFERPGDVMLGLVQSCDYTSVAVGNNVQEGISITGLDMGVMLNDFILQQTIARADSQKWREDISLVLGPKAPILDQFSAGDGLVNAKGEPVLFDVSIATCAEYAVKRVTGMQIPILRYAFGGRGYIGDFTEVRVSEFDGDRIFQEKLFIQETTVIGFLQQMIDRDFYELRMDTLPQENGIVPKPVLIVRPKPFDEGPMFDTQRFPPIRRNDASDWEKLRPLLRQDLQHHDVGVNHIVGQMRLGRSAKEAYTYYTVTSTRDLALGSAYPLLDLYNSVKYNTQKYDSRVSLLRANPETKPTTAGSATGVHGAIAPNAEAKSDNAEYVQDRRNRLFGWYRANPEFVTGSIRVRGNSSYRVGDPFYFGWLPDPLSGSMGIRAYCTQLTHDWQFGGGYSCNLSVARGHGKGFWDAYLQMVAKGLPELPIGWTTTER